MSAQPYPDLHRLECCPECDGVFVQMLDEAFDPESGLWTVELQCPECWTHHVDVIEQFEGHTYDDVTGARWDQFLTWAATFVISLKHNGIVPEDF